MLATLYVYYYNKLRVLPSHHITLRIVLKYLVLRVIIVVYGH
jgi:hypothetical protein